jgi:hypothetical protein
VSVDVEHRPAGVLVRAERYLLWLPARRPYALLTDCSGTPWAELFLASSLHTRDRLDDTCAIGAPGVEATSSGQRIEIVSEGTGWIAKRTVLLCAADEVRLTVSVEGTGELTDVHLLGGYYSGDHRQGSGFHQSGADFRSLCNPEPWGSERRVLVAGESTVLDVLGTSVPGKEHWQFTPPPLCLAFTREEPPAASGELPGGPWMTIGVAAHPGEYNFTALHYDAVEGAFSLRLTYEGQTRVSGRFTTPSVRLRFGAADPYAGFADHAASLRADGLAPAATPRRRPAWWSEPIFSGWGAQCVLSARSGGDPQDYATQQRYDEFLAALARHDLHPGTIVIDDKWQLSYGGWQAVPAKWPDLRAWIDSRHAEGRRVLLWWKAWDPEGVPEDWCVCNPLGRPLAVDPTNPDYAAALRTIVDRMLGPTGYGADGIKIDFSARTPSGPGLTRHGSAWGIELLHRLLEIVYAQAKCTKPDALVMTHTPHPYFADVTDMIRLNDINTRAPVVTQMEHRAKVARAACPQLLIDTDNWPMPDPASFRTYVAHQPNLGVPSLYYATHLDHLAPWSKHRGHVEWAAFAALRAEDGDPPADVGHTHVEMTGDDYRLIRTSWERARARDG